jgi:hypothetical protein
MRVIPSDPRGGFGNGRPPFHGFNGGFHYFNGGHNAGYWLGFALTILGFVILIVAGIVLAVRIASWLGNVAGIDGDASRAALDAGVAGTAGGAAGAGAAGGAGGAVGPATTRGDALAAELAEVRAEHARSLSELTTAIRTGVHRVREDLQTTIAIAVLSGVLLLVGFVLLTVYA